MGEVDQLKQEIRELSEKIVFLETALKNSQKEIIKEALLEFTNQNKEDTLKAEFVRKFNRSKKELIKQKIIEAIKIKPTSIADLKYYIVDQLRYCSKASFYRYIYEMKDLVEIRDEIAYPVQEIQVKQI